MFVSKQTKSMELDQNYDNKFVLKNSKSIDVRFIIISISNNFDNEYKLH